MVSWEYLTAYAENWRKEERMQELGLSGWEIFSVENTVGFVSSLLEHGVYSDMMGLVFQNCRVGVWVMECKRPAAPVGDIAG